MTLLVVPMYIEESAANARAFAAGGASREHEISMFAVYRNPSDFPGHIVVRQWWVARDGGRLFTTRWPHAVTWTLEQAHLSISRGRTPFNPDDADDPTLIEVWL